MAQERALIMALALNLGPIRTTAAPLHLPSWSPRSLANIDHGPLAPPFPNNPSVERGTSRSDRLAFQRHLESDQSRERRTGVAQTERRGADGGLCESPLLSAREPQRCGKALSPPSSFPPRAREHRSLNRPTTCYQPVGTDLRKQMGLGSRA
ncbi:hypothetical protein AAFF_G00116060 [Aldrovandia affinis]|uniref:Uncharacterized protein n=1 Tax=Aldrovandia affinis TaxID=143900 RepID=A0AAD7T1F7_9TELE|nr:hypothetical protein AAFF_G00116060 [Aldrovandia affinis]